MSEQAIPKAVREYSKLSRQLRREVKKDPDKARKFLLEAGIAVKSQTAPSGLALAKRYR
ncbi:MAG: hypothetical protein WD294_15190 [Phycisphaeraceae bacterium]